MSKRAKPAARSLQVADADVPEVGPREPCPCGSGRRYKACHGRVARAAATPFVGRPFEGLAGESDWVALREFVPAGTARVTLTGDRSDRPVTIATLLPMVAAGLVRPDGEIMIGLQVTGGSGDPSRDYATVVETLLDADPGTIVSTSGAPGAVRLQDLLDPSASLDVTLYDGFDYWADAVEDADGSIAASVERANAVVTPTARLTSAAGAYWCKNGDRTYLRWVRPEPEDALVDAFARLHVCGEDSVGPGTRYIGAFRAHGLLVSVWDLPDDSSAEGLEEPVAQLDERIASALADPNPLDPAERAARAGLRNRQRTLR